MLRAIVIIETLLLVFLVIIFRTELTTTAARIYLGFKDSAWAEQYIANYYKYHCSTMDSFSEMYYSRALLDLKKSLNTSPKETQPAVKMTLGRFYECGNSVKLDLTESKRYYEEAIKDDQGRHPEYKAALDRVNAAIEKGGTPPACVLQDEVYYMKWNQ